MTVRSQQIQIRVTPAEKAALKRLARRGGQNLSTYLLSRALPPAQLAFDRILLALGDDGGRRYALAELNDLLSRLTPAQYGEALRYADLDQVSAVTQNYVAAMVEQAAHRMGLEPPDWTRKVAPLEEPFFAAPLASLRSYLLWVAPVAFKRRNIFVDASIGNRV